MKTDVQDLYIRTSALDPAGPEAYSIFQLTSWMTWVFGIVFVVVMLLLIYGLFAKKHKNTQKNVLFEKWFILVGGLIFPTLVLTGLLIYTLNLTSQLRLNPSGIPIRVTGHMWWWEVEYPDFGIVTANEIYIPVGQRVEIELHSVDVIHSLWVPSLAGKMDLIPGVRNRMAFEASEEGIFWGQCAEYCGLAHAKMSLYVVALKPDDFESWIQHRKLSAQKNISQPISKGFELFHQVGCAECHAIQNTNAKGKIGPDLTHLGTRLTLGAGAISNNKGSLMGWISNPQVLKPGNKMPRTYMTTEQLQILTEYLMSLK